MEENKIVARGKNYVVTRLSHEEDMELMDPISRYLRVLDNTGVNYILEVLGEKRVFSNSFEDVKEARRQNDLYGI